MTPGEAYAAIELRKVARFVKQIGFTPRLWQSADGKVWVDETYAPPAIFEVTHADVSEPIRTTAAGVVAAVNKLRAQAASQKGRRRR